MTLYAVQKYIESPDFLGYLETEFRTIAANSTVEEMAEYAFGGIEEAIESFVSSRGNP